MWGFTVRLWSQGEGWADSMHRRQLQKCEVVLFFNGKHNRSKKSHKMNLRELISILPSSQIWIPQTGAKYFPSGEKCPWEVVLLNVYLQIAEIKDTLSFSPSQYWKGLFSKNSYQVVRCQSIIQIQFCSNSVPRSLPCIKETKWWIKGTLPAPEKPSLVGEERWRSVKKLSRGWQQVSLGQLSGLDVTNLVHSGSQAWWYFFLQCPSSAVFITFA